MNQQITQEVPSLLVKVEVNKQLLMKRRPSLLRSPPSIQLTAYTAHAHTGNSEEEEEVSPPSSSSSASSEAGGSSRKPHCSNHHSQQQTSTTTAAVSRTQHKIMLQRQSFLADDKNYLDHPDNMRRLTKELDRVNREYRCVKLFQDPFALSIQRVMKAALLQQQQQQQNNSSPPNSGNSTHYLIYSPTTVSSSPASSLSSFSNSYLFAPPSPQTATRLLQRRASSNTVHDYLLNFKDQQERRHSFSFYNTATDKSTTTISPGGLIGRLFGSSTHHSPLSSSSQLKRHTHVT